MRIVHINDKLTISGGVEVYIRDLMPLLQMRDVDTCWVAMGVEDGEVWLEDSDGKWKWRGTVGDLSASPIGKWMNDQTVFHVHSLSEPAVLEALFELAPVVRKVADPRMVCPGQGKFWIEGESPCTRPFGLHCLLHAYTKRCCNRHPKRLLRQFANARYEVRTASHRYAAMITNSRYTKRLLGEVGIAGERVRLCHNFTLVTPDPTILGDELSPTIVFAGRLSRTKGVHCLLEAMVKVCRALPEAQLEILGDGHDGEAFKEQAEDLGLASRVRFLGWADAAMIDRHLSAAAVVAFPSIYPEAFGIFGIEAMMRGKPVVGFDVGGVSDWLTHRVNGLLVPPKDIDAFAEGLIELLKDSKKATSYGRAGREIALAQFSPEPHMEKLMKIYKDALEAHPIQA